jgi:glycine cleavage system H protein
MSKLLISKEDLWLKKSPEPLTTIVTGLTNKVIRSLYSPVKFVRILPRGRVVNRGYPFGSIEYDTNLKLLRSPILGSIVEVNDKLRVEPEILNKDPYRQGWIAVMKPINFEEDLKDLEEVEMGGLTEPLETYKSV